MVARRLLVLGLAVVAVLATASMAAAMFTTAASSGPMSLSSSTLSAPGSVSATPNCVKHVSVSVTLGWTTSNFATGYTVWRSSGAAYSQIGTAGAGTTSFTDSTVAYSTAYTYYVVATFNSWTATSSTASATTLNTVCK